VSKIPVGATISHAYRFAFRNFAQIASIVWLPWLVLSVGAILMRAQTTAFSNAIAMRDASAIFSAMGVLVPFYFLSLFLMFMQIAGITQQALGLRTGSPYYYLNIGKPVWHLIGAFLLATLAVIIGYLLLLAIGVLSGLLIGLLSGVLAMSATLRTALVIIVFIVAFCVYGYSIVRLTFFLNPIAVAETRIDIKRSWSLAGGNFWRIILVLLAVLAPVMAVTMFLALHFLLRDMPSGLPLHASPDQIAAYQASVNAWSAATMKRSFDNWYIVYPAYGVVAALLYGLTCGAQSFAYRALVPEPASASRP
jgi:hypothetical protein